MSLLEPGMCGRKQDFVHWSLKRAPGFLPGPHLSLGDRITTDIFHSQILGVCLILALVLRAGDTSMSLRYLKTLGRPYS